MAVITEKQNPSYFATEFERLEQELQSGAPWFAPARQAAIAEFARQGLPTTRHEDWKYTNIGALAKTEFKPAAVGKLSLDQIRPFFVGDASDVRLVFINAKFDARLSSTGGLPKGVTLGGLAAAMTQESELLRSHLAQYAATDRNAFTALNTAFLQDGAFIHAGRGAIIEKPIHVIYVATGEGGPTVTHPHTLIVAEESSQVTVLESFVSVKAGQYFTNAVTEIVAADGSVVDHYKLQREADESFHIALLRTHQGRSTTVSSHSLDLGGGLVRNDVHAVLDGEGGDLDLNGLYLGSGQRHIDNHLRVEHAKAHCNSREYYKGILQDASHGVFTGRIVVHKDAQKTDAKQTNMNLLLSTEAQIDTKPQLEIFADDVKCTHGATIGQIEESELFYLRSRGISESEAKQLLIYAFASESIARVKVEPLRAAMEALLFGGASEQRRLQEAEVS